MADNKPSRQRKEESRATTIIRLAGKDIDGSLSIERALGKVKGIGFSLAHSMSHEIEKELGIEKTTSISSLDDKQIATIDNIIKNPGDHKIPLFMLNKRKHMETGKDSHFVGNDLIFATRQDITRDVGLKTWRGMRHQYGQKVRGQHTRSTGRTGATVGVTKKAAAPATAGAGTEKKEAAKK
jgi:small subunit ribosomal protein S13